MGRQLEEKFSVRRPDAKANLWQRAQNLRPQIEQGIIVRDIGTRKAWDEVDTLAAESGGWTVEMFNNLMTRLSGGRNNRPEYLKRWGDSRDNDPQASELRKKQSLREFLESCRKAEAEAGYQPEQVELMLAAWHELLPESYQASARFSEWKTVDELFAKMQARIYVALRSQGYNNYPDLTA